MMTKSLQGDLRRIHWLLGGLVYKFLPQQLNVFAIKWAGCALDCTIASSYAQ